MNVNDICCNTYKVPSSKLNKGFKVAEHCQFGKVLSNAYRDKFVEIGLNNESMDKWLLTGEQ